MADLKKLAEPAVSALVGQSVDDLYGELGRRLRLLQLDLQAAPDFAVPKGGREKVELESLGFIDDFKAFGKAFFERVNRQAYDLVCGGEAINQSDRQTLERALGVGGATLGSVIAGLLVAYLGMAPLVAGGVAVLIVNLFITPGQQSLCQVWKTKLPAPK